MNTKHRFEIKIAYMEGEDSIQILILSGVNKGAPIARGKIMRLSEASRHAFVEFVRQLDGGKIIQISQYEG